MSALSINARWGALSPERAARWDLTTVLTALAVAFGVLYRLILTLVDTPPTNSDEATMGIAAIHISQGERYPAYFYGQDYMGTLEAYLAVPIFWVFGPSIIGLRVPSLLMFFLFLLVMWKLVDLLYNSRGFTLFVVLLLALGSDRVVKNQMISGGGYPEMNPAGAGLMLLAAGICLNRYSRVRFSFFLFGFISGLMIWVDPLVLPYVTCAFAILAIFKTREVLGRYGVLLSFGVFMGALPLVVYSVLERINPVSTLLGLSGGGEPSSWLGRIYGGAVLGIPMGMGFCSPGDCATWQLWWGIVFPVLLSVAAFLAIVSLRSAGERSRVSLVLHLGLLIAAALTLVAYVRSNSAAHTPIESARYLSCLLISLPAVMWPLWSIVRRPVALPVWEGFKRVLAGTVLGGVAASVLIASLALIAAVPEMRDLAADRRDMIKQLERLRVDYVYSEYWTCNNITFATEERVICVVIDEGTLRFGLNRYGPYRDAAEMAVNPAYVLPIDSPANAFLERRLLAEMIDFNVVVVPGYRIIVPTRVHGLLVD